MRLVQCLVLNIQLAFVLQCIRNAYYTDVCITYIHDTHVLQCVIYNTYSVCNRARVCYTIHTHVLQARVCAIYNTYSVCERACVRYPIHTGVLQARVCAIWAAEGGCLEICTLSAAGGFNAPTIATNTFEYILSVHDMCSSQFKLIFSINISVRKMPEGEKGLNGLVYKV